MNEQEQKKEQKKELENEPQMSPDEIAFHKKLKTQEDVDGWDGD